MLAYGLAMCVRACLYACSVAVGPLALMRKMTEYSKTSVFEDKRKNLH